MVRAEILEKFEVLKFNVTIKLGKLHGQKFEALKNYKNIGV